MHRYCFAVGLIMTFICILCLALNPQDFLVPGIILLIISIVWTAGAARFLWCPPKPPNPIKQSLINPPSIQPPNYITISMQQKDAQHEHRTLMANLEYHRQQNHRTNMDRYQNTSRYISYMNRH